MRLGERLINRGYALCTRLYPRGFCAEFGDEMRSVFADAVSEAAESGSAPLIGVCWRELRDLPRSLCTEHWLSLRAWHASSAPGGKAGRRKTMSENGQREQWRIDGQGQAILAALPPLLYGAWIALFYLISGNWRTSMSPRQLVVHAVAMLTPLAVLVVGSLWAAARRLPDWSYAWVSAALMGLAEVLMALGQDRAFLFSPLLDGIVAVLFVLLALAALSVAALRGWAQAGLVSIGFAAMVTIGWCSALGRPPYHRLDLALVVGPLGMVLGLLTYLYVRGTDRRRVLLLLAVGLLNLSMLWMGIRVRLVRRSVPIIGMLPHLVIQMGALLSGPILALFVRPFRRMIRGASS